MIVEVAYVHGRCPLCGGPASKIIPVKSDVDKYNSVDKGGSILLYSSICGKCCMIYYVQVSTSIDDNRSPVLIRRNFIGTRDFHQYQSLFEDMVDAETHLIHERMGQYVDGK